MKVLVSACLSGRPCRYNGAGALHPLIARLCEDGSAVPICPEVSGGLPVPRPPSEIVGGRGRDIWAGRARVLTDGGRDVTDAFRRGAEHALAVARSCGATAAVLVDNSPSCGVRWIHDGSFTGRLCRGEGVTTACLEQHGIKVYCPDDPEVEALLGLERPFPEQAGGD